MRRTGRLPPRIARAVAHMTVQRDPRSEPQHAKLIRLLSCLITGAPGPNDIHHLKRAFDPNNPDPTAQRGMGLRTGDKWGLPLSRKAHHDIETTKIEGGEEAYLAALGFDGRAICRALWAVSGDLDAMERVIQRARQEAALKMRGAA